ncbi:hypothetical protein NUW54_g14609 [Trametes sanguinea]|uniref:Uncharacterized protein n=1 Tax=Trametes sanguinea TaxID=158606 RepID=A0ACC1MCK3_9APHY|nr:hypothetical protein NUW54_g14609 [Trametes sanguinea]
MCAFSTSAWLCAGPIPVKLQPTQNDPVLARRYHHAGRASFDWLKRFPLPIISPTRRHIARHPPNHHLPLILLERLPLETPDAPSSTLKSSPWPTPFCMCIAPQQPRQRNTHLCLRDCSIHVNQPPRALCGSKEQCGNPDRPPPSRSCIAAPGTAHPNVGRRMPQPSSTVPSRGRTHKSTHRHAPQRGQHHHISRVCPCTCHMLTHNQARGRAQVPGRLELFRQKPVQLLAHRDDASGHRLDIALPVFEQFIAVQNERNLFDMASAAHQSASRSCIYQPNSSLSGSGGWRR